MKPHAASEARTFHAPLSSEPSTGGLDLIAVAGPSPARLSLDGARPLTVGRRRGSDLVLPDPRVSRDHARIDSREVSGGARLWLLTDTRSTHGAWLNGLRIESERPTPIRAGDLIGIAPWTLQVLDRSSASTATRVTTKDDLSTTGSRVSRVELAEPSRVQHRLELLLGCAEAISAADDEGTLADAVLDAAVEGAGFVNAAWLHPMDEAGEIEIVAHRGDILGESGGPRLSRSLIRKASEGAPVRIAGTPEASAERSVVQLHIHEALCVPIRLGQTPVGFLYLDNRGSREAPSAEEGTAFALGLARLTAMALAGLRRREFEQRYARIEAELNAGAEAQRWILPPREGHFGSLAYRGRSQAGRFLGGDFFDVIPLSDERVAVSLGDVSGKGVPASILMTASEGFLHACLLRHGDVGRAVVELNRFVHSRQPGDRFLTLWLGVFDARRQQLHYVDAGHGHALLRDPDGRTELLTRGGGPPVGIDAGSDYAVESVALGHGGCALVVSDGVVDQPGAPAGRDRDNAFGMERVIEILDAAGPRGDAISALFSALPLHAGCEALADDATALLVHW